MEREKLIKEFNKKMRSLRMETVTAEDLEAYYTLIKEDIDRDIKDGYRDTIARNLTLGIGNHGDKYPKHLVLNGDEQGWRYIMRYLLWQQHILNELFAYKEVTSRAVGGIIGLSLLWGMEDLARTAREYFRLLFEGAPEKYAQKETHHLLMAILYDLQQSGEISPELYAVLPEGHVCKRLFDNWASEDEALLSALLREVCDFHIYSALDLKEKFSEILMLSFIPYDIRLIEKIRREQERPVINIGHPLLETPLAIIPAQKQEWDLGRDEVYQYLLSAKTGQNR